MKVTLSTLVLVGATSAGLVFANLQETADPVAKAPSFEKPVQLHAGGKPIQVEEPGYAAPCWHDVDGDGMKDLVVGQFSDGKMKLYKNLGDGTPGDNELASGEWLQAEDAPASVPGVW